MVNHVDVEIRERITSDSDGTYRAWVDLAIPDFGLQTRVLIGVFLTKREAQLRAALVAGNIRMARNEQFQPPKRVAQGVGDA